LLANRLRIERVAHYTRARLEATPAQKFPQYPPRRNNCRNSHKKRLTIGLRRCDSV